MNPDEAEFLIILLNEKIDDSLTFTGETIEVEFMRDIKLKLLKIAEITDE